MVKLGRKLGKKSRQLKFINWYVARGFSSRQIQKGLRKRNLGLRRKVLLHEIRLIKETRVSEEARKRAVPRKYRKKPPVFPPPKIDKIYRTSIILQDIPVHSRPMKRNYLGFRLQAFSLNKEYLIQQYRYLKEILMRETNKYLGFVAMENFNWNHRVLGIEKCVLILVSNANRLHNIWIFRVEKEGSEIYSRDGRI